MIVGCRWVLRTPVYSIVRSAHDRTPMCWHSHETAEEAEKCEEAIKRYEALTSEENSETMAK